MAPLLRVWVVAMLCLLPALAGASWPLGSTVQVTAPLLNIRQLPGGPVIGTAAQGTRAIVDGGPTTTVDGAVWYQLQYMTGITGWSNAAYVIPVTAGLPVLGIVLPPCAQDIPPCVSVTINGVPVP